MGDALMMRGLQRVGDLSSEREHAAERQGLAGDLLLQRLAPHQLHHEERPALLFADVVHRADVGMVQRRRGARLAREPVERLRAVRQVLRQELDGDVAPQPDVLGLVDDTHPSAADQGDDAVVGERLADDGQWHGGRLLVAGPSRDRTGGL